MKFANYGIIFAVLFLSMAILDDIRTEVISEMTKIIIQYNNAVDNAVEGAMGERVELDNGRKVFINKEEVMNRFLTGLYVNFDGMEYPWKKQLLEDCVPVAAFVDKDRLTITYRTIEGRMWEESYFEEYYEDGLERYLIRFTLEEYVYVKNLKTNQWLEGDFHDLKEEVFISFFKEDLLFDEIRRRTIVNALEEKLTESVTLYNHYAKKIGMEYQFSFPVLSKEEWYQTVDEMSFFALFQGYPYNCYGTRYFSKVAFGGARLNKTFERTFEESNSSQE